MVLNSSDALLPQILQARAADHPDEIAFTFLANGEEEAGSLTYGQLDKAARSIAARLRSSTVTGDRVLLLYPSGLDYIAAIFGCFYAGVVAVPAYSPQNNSDLRRLQSIVRDSQAAVALAADNGGPFAAHRMVVDSAGADDYTPVPPPGHSTAVLQYTSGSTAEPKGVMVSHANIIHNVRILADRFAQKEGSTVVSWLPIFHDMGLIGVVAFTVFTGARCILMPPASFIQRPVRWLDAISKYRGELSAAPNFAYELCVRSISDSQKANLDLRSWRVAVNGSEPVRPATIQKFVNTFAPCGLRPDVIRPSYGLAESTLFVTSNHTEPSDAGKALDAVALERGYAAESEESKTGVRTVANCGSGTAGQKIAIVDPFSFRSCGPKRVGEVWIASPSVAGGYWNRPDLTRETFQARLADTGEGPFLRTGDLGFLDGGDLYLTGRLKDLIVIAGRNHYPHDIEDTVSQSNPALVAGGGAAFSAELHGEERLIVVHEVKRTAIRSFNATAVANDIRQAIARNHQIQVGAIEFVRPMTIPKTSSGKIQRALCRSRFLAGELQKITAGDAAVLTDANGASASGADHPSPGASESAMNFSLLYFSSDENQSEDDKYRLFLEGAQFADAHDFQAIWIPERHFHQFGGLYPNPSVLAAAVAVTTKRIRIRAGSVVLPLHNPIRVAEEWSVVDNLSNGRVDLAFARGWNPNDFVFAPSNFPNALEVLNQSATTVQKLWRGESISAPNGKGADTNLRIYPAPRQRELPLWLTCTGGVERFVEAGKSGWNVLTALLFQPTSELAEKIAAYRDARAKSGYDPNTGHVTLMMHTYVGVDEADVREQVREPFIEYLRSSADLWRQGSEALANLTEAERAVALDFAFERYYRTSALFGTPENCRARIQELRKIGVNEIACLIDFGLDTSTVLAGLKSLSYLHESIRAGSRRSSVPNLRASSAAPERRTTVLPTPQRSVQAIREREPADTERFDNSELLGDLRELISNEVARVTRVPVEELRTGAHFLNLGMDSLKAVEIMGKIQDRLNLTLPHSILFEHPTIDALAAAVARLYAQQAVAVESAASQAYQQHYSMKGSL